MNLDHRPSSEDQAAPSLGAALSRIGADLETLREPLRLRSFEHWIGHIPFAFWMVAALRPRVFVELGTHRGNSYLAFCQAIQATGCGTKSFAVDTWNGDVHMAQEQGLFEELSAYHDRRYGDFSCLLRSSFDDARQMFGEKSIDLLHIDGTHTYDAVRHDFENWAPALSERAVVLFHDTNVRRAGYGVWKLWEELRADSPHFEFFHSYGLGVLGYGSQLPWQLTNLFEMSGSAHGDLIRAYFAARGQSGIHCLTTENLIRELDNTKSDHRNQLAHMERERLEKDQVFAEFIVKSKQDAENLRIQETDLLQREVSDANYALKSAEAEITSRLAEIEELRCELRDSKLATEYAAEVEAALRQQINAMRHSRSWQITYPGRRLGSIARSLVRRLRHKSNAVTLDSGISTVLPLPSLSEVRAEARDGAVGIEDQSLASHINPTIPTWEIELPDLFALRAWRPECRVAVVVHIYYEELWPILKEAIEKIPENYDLFVSLTEGISAHIKCEIVAAFPDAHIYIFPNRGRDMLPLVAFASTGVLGRYKYICKLHTKRSPHRPDGDAWRDRLIAGILSDRANVAKLLNMLDQDENIGIVVADGELYTGGLFWTGNVRHAGRLLPRMGYNVVDAESRPFAGGSIFWLRSSLLYDLIGLNISFDEFEPEPIGPDGALAHTLERLLSIICWSSGREVVEASKLLDAVELKECTSHEDSVDGPRIPRIVAFYLPQFHPIPENDRWWGEGFTEWTNVTKAKPLFEGHRQPKLPGELGFTDLRLPEVRQAQANLAARYGISAFCYYFYWFGAGRKLLNRPLDQIVNSGKPDFPFMICWANEPWTRNWDGVQKDVLVPQSYDDNWPEDFARDVAPLLKDPRYVRLRGEENKPILLIYRIMHIPTPGLAIGRLRNALRALGVGEVHIAAGWMQIAGDPKLPDDAKCIGLDAFFEFPPHAVPSVEIPQAGYSQVAGLYNYRLTVDAAIERLQSDTKAKARHAGVMMGWDNTARRGRSSHVFHGATPGHFRRWIRAAILAKVQANEPEERMVFVNAWNEWAEGTCLEPDRDFGRGWLSAVESALPYRVQLERTRAFSDHAGS